MKWLRAIVYILLGFAVGLILGPKEGEVPSSKTPSTNLRYDPLTETSDKQSKSDPIEEFSAKGEITAQWLSAISQLQAFDQIGALYSRIKEIDSSQFPQLMKFATDTDNWEVSGIVATRWAQLDPEGMLAYAQKENSLGSYGLYNTIFTAWAKQNPQSAYAAALQLDSKYSQQAAIQAVVTTIASIQPQRAIEIAKEYYGNGSSGRGRWLYQSVYRIWAQKDGASARQSALNLEEGVAKTAALAGAMQEWMIDDPVEALAWLDSLPMDSAIYGSRKQVFRNFLNQDFEAAKDYIDSVKDPFARRQIIENLQFHHLGWQKSYEEIEAVFDWMGTVATGEVYDRRVSNVISAMTESDPDRAIDFVLNMRAGNARLNGLRALGSKLAEIDPKLAFEFIDSLHYQDEKTRLLGSMSWRLSQQDIESTSTLVAAHSDPDVQRQLATNISKEWSNFDIDAARIWSESLSDEQARQSALRNVINKWIESDPAATMVYIENTLKPDDQASALNSAYSSWARNDPQAAVEWLDRLPENLGDRKSDIYGSVAQRFIHHDPMAASEWIATLEDSPERDKSVETLINQISATDPGASFIWAATLGADDKRKSGLTRSIQEWIKTDPAAAYDAVVAAKLQAAEKESLLKMIEGKH